MTWVACAGLAVCCWAFLPAAPGGRVVALFDEAGPRKRGGPPGWLRWGWMVGLGLVVGIVAPRLLVWLVPGLAAVACAVWLITQARDERERHARADEVVQACQALSAQLRAGDIPARALSRVALDSPLLAPVAATQAIGGDVPAALHAVSERPGCGGLAALGRAWQLCQQTGAPVARAAKQVAESLHADASAERLVAGELAAPRASGRMLAALPLMGVGMGFVGGGDPIRFLTTTLPGQICLAAAVCLVCAGLVWTTLLGRLPQVSRQ